MKFNNKNVEISKSARIGENVKIGDNTIIYDNVVIGDNTIISNNCIIGEPTNDYYFSQDYKNQHTKIGSNSVIRSHSLIYSGCKIGDNFNTGHRVTIRENSKIGNNCAVGTLSDLQGHLTIGNYCRFHSNVHIGQGSVIGNFVFIYPYVVLTNDPHPPSNICEGATIGNYTQIAVHSVILPGVKVGENCLIGANSTVNRNTVDGIVLAGSPAKEVCKIHQVKSKEKGNEGNPHYPWMYNFERGMPWEGIGFDAWSKNNKF